MSVAKLRVAVDRWAEESLRSLKLQRSIYLTVFKPQKSRHILRSGTFWAT